MRIQGPARGEPQPRIFVIIPAYNEEESLPHVIDALRNQPCRLHEIVVVDNGSHDRTGRAAAQAGATVLEEPVRGYGAACLRGLDYLSQKHSPAVGDRDIVVFLDADFSDYPEDLPRLLEPIHKGHADFVTGSRLATAEARRAVPFVARLGNRLATTVIHRLHGLSFTDLGPFRAIRYGALMRLGMRDRTWGWTLEMQLNAARSGIAACEVPVRYRPRLSGASKISGSVVTAVRAGTRILWMLTGHAVSHAWAWMSQWYR